MMILVVFGIVACLLILYNLWRAHKTLQNLRISNWSPGDSETRSERTKR